MIPLHDDEHVHMAPRVLDASDPLTPDLLPYAIAGAHVEDTVSTSLDGATTYIERVVTLPGYLERVDMAISFSEDAK